MTSTDTTLQAADSVFAAEQAVNRARRVVQDLHTTIASALRVLEDAELDSAKVMLTNRGDFYLQAAVEHLGRFQTRCNDLPQLVYELDDHFNRASQAVGEARDRLNDPDTTDPAVATDIAQLNPRIAVLGEMVSLAKPIARLAARHLESARRASQEITPSAPLEPVALERSIGSAGKELGRADEDVRLVEDVIDRAAASARQAASIASEISDNARRRMTEQARDPNHPVGTPAPTTRAPAR
jgi:hypothetical protein